MFVVSIVMAATAGKTSLTRAAAFVVASIFGFLSCIFYIIILVFTGLQIKKSGGIKVSTPSNAQQGSETA